MIIINKGKCLLVCNSDMKTINILNIKPQQNSQIKECSRIVFSGSLLKNTIFNFNDFCTVEDVVYIPGYIIQCETNNDASDCLTNIVKGIETELTFQGK